MLNKIKKAAFRKTAQSNLSTNQEDRKEPNYNAFVPQKQAFSLNYNNRVIYERKKIQIDFHIFIFLYLLHVHNSYF